MTDIHVQPELNAAEGYQQCISEINLLDPRPDFAIAGGDLIIDALEVDLDRSEMEFNLFDECSRNLELPVHHVIGNHDIVAVSFAW